MLRPSTLRQAQGKRSSGIDSVHIESADGRASPFILTLSVRPERGAVEGSMSKGEIR